MFAKLFSRIAQSSLMEEQITTRYIFMMMIAIADRHGDIIGTDVAIARMINVTKKEFTEGIKALLDPDPDSNSQAEEGRRLVPSENGRGYKVVNYQSYREMKSDDEKREYMRNYMRERRAANKETVKPVNSVKNCKPALNDVTQAEAEAEVEEVSYTTKRQEFPKPEDVTKYATSAPVPISEACAIAFYDTQEAQGWITKHGHPILDWRAALRRFSSHWNQYESQNQSGKLSGTKGSSNKPTIEQLMGGRKLNITKASDLKSNAEVSRAGATHNQSQNPETL